MHFLSGILHVLRLLPVSVPNPSLRLSQVGAIPFSLYWGFPHVFNTWFVCHSRIWAEMKWFPIHVLKVGLGVNQGQKRGPEQFTKPLGREIGGFPTPKAPGEPGTW